MPRPDAALAAVTCPVLLVRGRHDRIAPADWLQTLAATADRGQAQSLPAGGHMIPLTHPMPLATRIRHFLGGVESHR